MAATICIWNIFVMITYLEGNINIYGLLKGQDIEWKMYLDRAEVEVHIKISVHIYRSNHPRIRPSNDQFMYCLGHISPG